MRARTCAINTKRDRLTKADVNPEQVRKLAAIGCKVEEIANIVGCHRNTIHNRFAGELERGREEGKMSLRRKQFEVALSGNVSMLIWLGKQMLGQTDKQEINATPKEIHVRIGGPQLSEPEEGDDAAEI